MAECQWERRIHPHATRIGATVNYRICHGLAASGEIFLGAALILYKTGNSAHGNSSLIFDQQPV
jgi:hypothetical protein